MERAADREGAERDPGLEARDPRLEKLELEEKRRKAKILAEHRALSQLQGLESDLPGLESDLQGLE